MLGVDQRVLKIVWTVFLFALAVVLIYAIRDALITFTLAIFLALLLSPLVSLVDHFTSVRVPRTVALMVVYVLMIAAFAAVLIGIASAVAVDARALSVRLPDALRNDPLAGLPLPAWLDPARERLGYWLRDQFDPYGGPNANRAVLERRHRHADAAGHLEYDRADRGAGQGAQPLGQHQDVRAAERGPGGCRHRLLGP